MLEVCNVQVLASRTVNLFTQLYGRVFGSLCLVCGCSRGLLYAGVELCEIALWKPVELCTYPVRYDRCSAAQACVEFSQM